MRFLADENVPLDVVMKLRKRGHDVAWVRTGAPGSGDREVLALAAKQERVLPTFDKDFGELAYRGDVPAACGIVLLRIAMSSPPDAVRKIVAAIESRQDWAGHFTVVEENRIRMRRLPGGRGGRVK